MPSDNLRMQERRWWGWLLLGLYVALIFLTPILARFTRPVDPGFTLGLARTLGLVGFAMLAIQIGLGSRLRFIDRPWGLDTVMRFHKRAAIAAFFMLALHPLVLLFLYASQMDLGFGVAVDLLHSIYSGIIALALLVVVLFTSLYFKLLRVNYQLWRQTHKAAVAVVVVGFIHGLRHGPEMPFPMNAYYWALFVCVVALFLFRNLYTYIWGRRKWRVASVKPETHDTYTLTLEPANDKEKPLDHRPGQFIFLRLVRPGRSSEEHPFTISSSPPRDGKRLTFTIKKSGDFTDTIGETQAGDSARIHGPFGRFSYQFHAPKGFVFIAGGVGITPILSMLRHLHETGDRRPAVLIFGNRTEGDIIAREELEAMPDTVDVHHVLTTPSENWRGFEGYVNGDLIEECAGELLAEADVYLCGPPPMMDLVTKELKALGVRRSRIHSERFTL